MRIADFGASAIMYRVWFWVDDFDPDGRAQDQVRSYIYYAFKPQQHHHSVPDSGGDVAGRRRRGAGARRPSIPTLLASVPMFAPLAPRASAPQLLAVARPVQYAAGEAIVRQGQTGRSLFVVIHGEASVTLAGTSGEVARLRAGDVFGEMSLLTGEARTATVTAATDCDLLEIDAEGFRSVVMANPSVLEHVDQRDGVAARGARSPPRNPRRRPLADRGAPLPPEPRPPVPAPVESSDQQHTFLSTLRLPRLFDSLTPATPVY